MNLAPEGTQSGVPRPSRTPERTVNECAALIGATVDIRHREQAATIRITGITHDSRAVQPGDVYAAMPGLVRHGASFGASAAASGAVAIVTDEAGAELLAGVGVPVLTVDAVRPALGRLSAFVYGEPATDLPMFGVTGTNGKTTTTYLVDGGLRRAGLTTGVIGTVQILIGAQTVPSVRTTPEAPDLQAILAVARERGIGAVAMEVSSHALAYGRTDGVRFAVAAFLNLTQDHLDFHADLEHYFEAKAKLFTPGYAHKAVVNVDDRYGREIADRCRSLGVELSTVSAHDKGETGADWRVEDVELGPDGSTFTVRCPDGARVAGSVGLPGDFNVGNALVAIAMLVAGGIDPETAAAGVGDVHGVPGRMERVAAAGQGFLAVVDYAHTPDAIATALSALRPVTAGRLRIVVGCGGDRDRGKRPLMGAAAVRIADETVFTDDNPRAEDPAAILAAVTAGADAEIAAQARPGTYTVIADRAAAIAYAVRQCRPGDTLIVAGKGHEQGQETAGVTRPFDDRVVLRAALEAATTATAAKGPSAGGANQ